MRPAGLISCVIMAVPISDGPAHAACAQDSDNDMEREARLYAEDQLAVVKAQNAALEAEVSMSW